MLQRASTPICIWPDIKPNCALIRNRAVASYRNVESRAGQSQIISTDRSRQKSSFNDLKISKLESRANLQSKSVANVVQMFFGSGFPTDFLIQSLNIYS